MKHSFDAIKNAAINKICAGDFFSKGDTLNDLAAPIAVAAAEAEKYALALKDKNAVLLFLLRTVYAVGFHGGMLTYRAALAIEKGVPEEDFNAAFPLEEFNLDEKAARDTVKFLKGCRAEDLRRVCRDVGFEMGGVRQ